MSIEDLLKKHEGLRLLPYKDTTGNLTIGYGTNISQGITVEVAQLLLEFYIKRTQNQLADSLSWYEQASENVQMVLTDMAYNMGIGGLLAFKKMLAALQAGDIDVAIQEMQNSLWAKQVPNRCSDLIRVLKGGE